MGLSLAVAAKGHFEIKRFFDALEREGIFSAQEVDIHLAHDSGQQIDRPNNTTNLYMYRCRGDTSILKLWGRAIAECKQEYVAVLDVNCPPATGWFKAVVNELQYGTDIFYGCVDPLWQGCDKQIVGYVTEYVQFHCPLPDSLDEVPGNNVVFKKDLIDDGDKLKKDGFYKTFMIWKLRHEKNIEPKKVSSISVSYAKPFRTWHYMQRRFIHGRCFAVCRQDDNTQPHWLLCLGFTPILPFLRVWRIFIAVKKHKEMRFAFFRYFHLVWLSELAWSLGEFLGYSIGGRECCDKLD